MKSFKILAAMAIGATTLFTACDDDLDNNPVLQSPSTFTLNTPAYTSSIDLASSSTLEFSWSQPDYGFPLQAEYQLYASTTNAWTASVDEASADESGATVATYGAIGDATTDVTTTVNAEDLARLLEQLEGWEEGAVPETQTVYVRCSSTVNGSTIYSNTVTISVVPYYYELTDADPVIWYLVGSCIGDGSWGTEIGVSAIPMYTIAGQEYDSKTGTGVISWTGYLTTDGFKLRGSLEDNWATQIGQGDSFGSWLVNDGGSGNITVPENGIYTVTLNTETNDLTVEAYDGTPTVYTEIYCTGDFDSWAVASLMIATATYSGAENHDWYFDLDASSGDTTAKFTLSDWSVNWGDSAFPYGTGLNNGSNIAVTAGSYRIMFNDITGQYYFWNK